MAFAPPLAPVSNATVSVTPAVVPPNVTFAALSPPDPEDLKDKIRHQIEYYFSEENLVKDVFIRKKMDCDGYLPISLIASFHRVASLTQDVNMIISALKDSLSVELSESQLKARPRNHPKSWPMSDKPIGSNSNAPLDSSSSSTNPTSPSSSITASAPSNSSSSPPSSLSNVNGTSNQTVNSATDASSREFVTSTYQLTTNATTTDASTVVAVASETASSPPLPVLDSVSTAASSATVVSTNEIINDTVETATAAAASVTAAPTSVNVVATSSGSTTNDSLNATSPANKSPRQQDTNVVGGNSELHADVPSFVPGKPYNVTTTSDSSP